MIRQSVLSLTLLFVSIVCLGQIRIQTMPGKHMGALYINRGDYLSSSQIDSLSNLGYNIEDFLRAERKTLVLSNCLLFGGICLGLVGNLLQEIQGYPDGERLKYNKESIPLFISGAVCSFTGIIIQSKVSKRLEGLLNKPSISFTMASTEYGLGFIIRI